MKMEKNKKSMKNGRIFTLANMIETDGDSNSDSSGKCNDNYIMYNA